jgi:hypothetical protein
VTILPSGYRQIDDKIQEYKLEWEDWTIWAEWIMGVFGAITLTVVTRFDIGRNILPD